MLNHLYQSKKRNVGLYGFMNNRELQQKLAIIFQSVLITLALRCLVQFIQFIKIDIAIVSS